MAEPVIEVEDEVPEIVAPPEADPVLPPSTELPPEFAPPVSTVPSAVEEAARLNGEVEDDLTAISGIGPATARRLRHEGLTSFAQIAELNDEAIDELAPKLKNRAERIGPRPLGGAGEKAGRGTRRLNLAALHPEPR